MISLQENLFLELRQWFVVGHLEAHGLPGR